MGEQVAARVKVKQEANASLNIDTDIRWEEVLQRTDLYEYRL